MYKSLFLTLFCCLLLCVCAPAQQNPNAGRRHASSHGGYFGGVKGYSHRGGLFRKTAPLNRDAKKKKEIPVTIK